MSIVDDRVWVYYKFDAPSTDGTEDELVDSAAEGTYGGKCSTSGNIITADSKFGNAFTPVSSGYTGGCAKLRLPKALQNFTLSFWVKPMGDDLDGNYHCIFQKPSDMYLEFYTGGGIKLRIYGGTATTYGAGKFVLNQWAHVVLSVGCRHETRIWINKELVGAAHDTTLETNNAYAWCGNWNGSSSERLDGNMDEFVVYKREATQGLVDALYNESNGIELNPTNLSDCNGLVDLKVTALSKDNDPIPNARVYLIAEGIGSVAAGTVLFNTLTDSSGQVVLNDFTFLENQEVSGWIRKADGPFYKTQKILGVITSLGLDLRSYLEEDQ